MQAAQDPNAESAESAIKELTPERRMAVLKHRTTLDNHFGGVINRGSQILKTMSADDWQALKEDTNEPLI